MDRDRALSLLDSYTRTRLDARSLHPLLLELAEVLDRAPTQVIGPRLRLRWPLDPKNLLQVKVLPLASPGEPMCWVALHEVMDGRRALHADHMNLRYTGYPEFRCRPPYLWNLGLVPRDQWMQDMISPVVSWPALVQGVGEMVSGLPAELAALPVDWFDGTIRVHDPEYECLDLEISRHGIRAKAKNFQGERGDLTAAMVLSPAASLQLENAFLETYASCFSRGFPLGHTGLKATCKNARLSSFRIMDDASENPRSQPDFRSRFDDLLEAADWVDGPHQDDCSFEDLTTPFPAWEPDPTQRSGPRLSLGEARNWSSPLARTGPPVPNPTELWWKWW